MSEPFGTDAATPARAAARAEHEGVLLLADADGTWAHGAEPAVEQALLAARDRSDMSDELAWLGRGWPQSVETARERGHIVRPLKLTREHRVLEVGAGCGAVTRSLAERCGLVDALELNLDRARLAALRLADCPNARVLAGDVSDIPEEPAYDVVVVVGVLEYIGGHTGIEERVAWLRRLRSLLRPGGHIVCAIENRFGVGYLAGGPEDHSGRLFQGVEDHPVPFPARTFARVELERLFTGAGLHPTTLGVFPDYRLPRFIFSPRLLESPAAPLAWHVPRFPTPPHPSHAGAFVLDERRVYRGLVTNGMGLEFANSFLVVAGRDAPQRLWDDDRLGVFYSLGRRRVFATESVIAASDDGVWITRTPLRGDSEVPEPLVQRCGAMPYVAGTSLLDLIADADDAALDGWLARLRGFVAAHARHDGATEFDVWPGNIVVAGNELTVVDTELAHTTMPAEAVFPRALLLTALELPLLTIPARWPVETGRELMAYLAQRAGLDAIDIDGAVRRQAELIALILAGEPGSEPYETRLTHEIAELNAALDRPLAQASVHGAIRDAGPGLHAQVAVAERERDEARAFAVERAQETFHLREALNAAERDLAGLREQLGEVERRERDAQARLNDVQAQLGEAQARLSQTEKALQTVYTSRSWRLTEPLRTGAKRLRGRSGPGAP